MKKMLDLNLEHVKKSLIPPQTGEKSLALPGNTQLVDKVFIAMPLTDIDAINGSKSDSEEDLEESIIDDEKSKSVVVKPKEKTSRGDSKKSSKTGGESDSKKNDAKDIYKIPKKDKTSDIRLTSVTA